jgi:hypothetical protein
VTLHRRLAGGGLVALALLLPLGLARLPADATGPATHASPPSAEATVSEEPTAEEALDAALAPLPAPLPPAPADGWSARARRAERLAVPLAPAPSPPVHVRMPAADIDAALVPVGLEPDGAMQVPDFGLAGWYEPGPMPGQPGPAVIAGHVDSWRGPDVFFGLRHAKAGDEIEVDLADGRRLTFEVERVELHPKDELPVDAIWSASSEPLLRLITCGGDFDRTRRSYTSNVVVFARAAG